MMIKCIGGLTEYPDVGDSFMNQESCGERDDGEFYTTIFRNFTYRKEYLKPTNSDGCLYYVRDDFTTEQAIQHLLKIESYT